MQHFFLSVLVQGRVWGRNSPFLELRHCLHLCFNTMRFVLANYCLFLVIFLVQTRTVMNCSFISLLQNIWFVSKLMYLIVRTVVLKQQRSDFRLESRTEVTTTTTNNLPTFPLLIIMGSFNFNNKFNVSRIIVEYIYLYIKVSE